MSKRGLVIVVGATGSGKSTSLAAMVGYRNEKTRGHIVTIEDPVEYVHPHRSCVVTHREIGVDTDSWHTALKNTLRQAPDVIMIGEIRDRETMEYGIQFSETGHLVLATLHANSSNQALDRIINFFPEEKREQLLMDLSLNIRALVSQRLIPREEGTGRIAAMEIMIGTPLISDLIFRGEVAEIKEVMSRSNRLGMKTFDQALFDLYEAHSSRMRRRCATPTRRTSCGCASSWRASARTRLEADRRAQDARGRGIDGNESNDVEAPGATEERLSDGGRWRRARPAPGEHQAAVAADGGEEGFRPVLHVQCPGQDQDRGQHHPVNKQVLTAETVKQAALGLMRPSSSSTSTTSSRSTSRSRSRVSAASAPPCSTSAATRRWCCATSAPTPRRSNSSACRKSSRT